MHNKTILKIQQEYTNSDIPWLLGYSGGKDSSALLKLVFQSLKELRSPQKKITVIFCDTGVEIPVVKDFVIDVFNKLNSEAEKHSLPIFAKIIQPKLEDGFFVRIIGNGYPSPTNKFRWCTRRLRINPMNNEIQKNPIDPSIVLLGIRKGESVERDRTIERHKTEKEYYFNQSEHRKTIVFAPLIEYSAENVWDILLQDNSSFSFDFRELAKLYRITLASKLLPSEMKSRFGCWTCTVIRKERAMSGLIENGMSDLIPLMEFRNWLLNIRDNPQYRCQKRRNGCKGPGPFKLQARQEILWKLLATQKKCSWQLITNDEIKFIKQLWAKDSMSEKYLSIE